MQTKNTIRIVVASPGDVAKERDVVTATVAEFNPVIQQAGFEKHISVGRWETDVPAGFHADGPQKHVDQYLRPTDCDVFIGIFWRRFGERSVEGRSPTEHEIRAAVAAWQKEGKPKICLFFRTDGEQPRNTRDSEQLTSVLAFKDEIRPLGIYVEYGAIEEFTRKVSTLLFRTVMEALGSDNRATLKETDTQTDARQIDTRAPLSLILTAENPDLRNSGVTELVGDLYLDISNCEPERPYVLKLFTQPSINITSRLRQRTDLNRVTNYSSAHLCSVDAGKHIQEEAVAIAANAIAFKEITFSGTARKLKISGIRVNASQLENDASVQVLVTLTTAFSQHPVTTAVAVVGQTRSPKKLFDVSWPNGQERVRISSLPQVDPLLQTLPANLIVTIADTSSLKTRSTEADSADHGTRFGLSFVNVPSGLRVYVTTRNVNEEAGQFDLIQTDPNGSGPFSPANSQSRPNEAESGVQMEEISLVGGYGMAVWEVTKQSSPGQRPSFVVSVLRSGEQVSPGAISLRANLLPISTSPAASVSGSIPRFVDTSKNIGGLTLANDSTRLLYPFITSQAGLNTGISIANVSGLAFRTAPEVGSFRLYFFGYLGASPYEGVHEGPSLNSGQSYAWDLSNQGDKSRSLQGFQGYVIAECNFKARGVAWIAPSQHDDTHPGSCYVAEVLPE